MEPLPEAVKQAIHATVPDARVIGVEYERRVVRLIEVTLMDGDQDYDVIFSEDGTILAIDQPIAPRDLPSAVRDAIKAMPGNPKIHEAEQVKTLAELRATPLTRPRIEYEVKIRVDDKLYDVTISQDGSTIKTTNRLMSRQAR